MAQHARSVLQNFGGVVPSAAVLRPNLVSSCAIETTKKFDSSAVPLL